MRKQGQVFPWTAIVLAVAALVAIAVFTPVVPWLKGALLPAVETPQPTIPSTESPQTTETPPLTEISPPETAKPENTLIFSEKELQDKVDALIVTVNQSGEAKIEYIRVKLEQDRMRVSVKGEALGQQAEAEDLEVRFEERTVLVSGKVSAFGLNPTLTAEVEIYTEEGKLRVEVRRFKLGDLPLTILGLSTGKISEIVNGAIESRGLKLPVDIESIRIEDGKLMVKYK